MMLGIVENERIRPSNAAQHINDTLQTMIFRWKAMVRVVALPGCCGQKDVEHVLSIIASD